MKIQKVKNMPLFMVKQKYYDQIAEGRKTIEVNQHNRKGDTAVFQCGRNQMIRKQITVKYTTYRKDEFLALIQRFYRRIDPDAKSPMRIIRDLSKFYKDTQPKSMTFYFIGDEIPCQ